MKKTIAAMLDEQVNKELYSAYLYLGISKFFSRRDLPGFAAWYRIQAEEEQEHAMKIYDYLLDQDEDVSLSQIGAVEVDIKDPLDAAKAADAHERYITGEIEKIMDAAVEEKDYRTQLFLNWFIAEQQEEEKNSRDMVSRIERLGTKEKGLYLLDHEVGKREG